jgi:hypothetical protein
VIHQELGLRAIFQSIVEGRSFLLRDLRHAEPIPEPHDGIRCFWSQPVSLFGDQVTGSREDSLTGGGGSGNPGVVARNLRQVRIFQLMEIPPLEDIRREGGLRSGEVALQFNLPGLSAAASSGSWWYGFLRPKNQKILRIGNPGLFWSLGIIKLGGCEVLRVFRRVVLPRSLLGFQPSPMPSSRTEPVFRLFVTPGTVYLMVNRLILSRRGSGCSGVHPH